MANHFCPAKPPKYLECHCPSCPPKLADPVESQASIAAKLLKDMATHHEKGSTIPPDIEAAADAWTWLKLCIKDRIGQIKTPGRPAYVQMKRPPPKDSTLTRPPTETSPSSLDTDHTLAMMRDCHLTWDQIRKLRQYLTNAGIPSERAMRNRQATLIGDNLEW
ncbi:uncharacterized protein LOC117299705 [Asterias rubens]|uniref:uncharacterized protein LOC117299705 n=1 Tax=Asterias rubens TaxID=7604 RepID=UPI00145527A3|nr:uncharacterized protein LOC117299705 [Asterias rubens]